MGDGSLFKPGRFLTHRTLSTVAADSATINTTNFPLSNAFSGAQCQSIWIVWHGTGGTSADSIRVVPLVWNGISSIWCLLPEIVLTKDSLTELSVHGANLMYLAVSDVGGTSCTALTIDVAKAKSAIVE